MTDIIIIGGGVAGISAAARLAPDAAVTVLEAEDSLAYHASGRSAAMFIRDYGNATVKALNAASADHHHHADGGVLSRRGMMLVARADEAAAFHAEAADLGLSEITLDEAAALWPILNPDTVGHAAYRPDAYDLDTDLLIQNFARAARGHGAQIVTRAPVTAITRANGRWRVTAGGQDHAADIVVNAAGAWADDVAAMAGVATLGITPLPPLDGAHRGARGAGYVRLAVRRWHQRKLVRQARRRGADRVTVRGGRGRCARRLGR